MKGTLVVISGPSGVGKTTVVRKLLEKPAFERSVSATTRAARPGEVDGKDYFFWSREKFAQVRDAGGFLEHAEIHGNGYGTPAEAVDRMLAAGKMAILAIDVQGFDNLKRLGRDFLGVFLMPPSREELRKRIEGRGDTKDVERRLKTAEDEMARKDEYEVVVVNREVDQAVADIESALRKRKLI